ncbi:hypothetical protein MBRA1_001622 [Malassezia brasiliensis]|uniref:BAR domain-containing protein n=1 Tax=Malassezia brasiliensis TaxID=1821822 RepID=A0AAF0ISI5_9BASI|nr:hypothetical protein MBRA1_001622 [Malassezia brasiliensis]
MEHWKNLTSSVAPIGQKITERFGTLNQHARERLGQTNDITELPDEYRELEQRVDALKNAQQAVMRTARTFEHEGYDYPGHLQESVTYGAQSLSHTLSTWAASATKHTSLPHVQPTNAPSTEPRTLSHALSRSAASAAIDLGKSPQMAAPHMGADPVPTNESRLGELLQKFAVCQDEIGNARIVQDKAVVQSFVNVWSAFGAQIQLALKARHAVKEARLHLDSKRSTLKSAEANGTASAKLEVYSTDVELAEDKLVSATEEAISLMKTVLDNPEPAKSLASFVQAQLEYHRAAVRALEQLDTEMSTTVTSIEQEYRASRS